jgi:lactoylglutathione lyase/methylmalonyl-CoA/ethylmalonyl-CoA epimerase
MAEIKRVDHVAIAVRDLDKGIKKYEEILNAKLITKVETVMAGSRMAAAYLKVGENIIVLDAAVDPDGFMAKFIEKRGEGLHHLGLEVDDLDGFVEELADKGVNIPHRESLGPSRREILLSPKDLCGVVMQVIEWKAGADLDVDQRVQRLLDFSESRSKETSSD